MRSMVFPLLSIQLAREMWRMEASTITTTKSMKITEESFLYVKITTFYIFTYLS